MNYIVTILLLLFFTNLNAQVFKNKTGSARLFSTSPLEDIEAKTNKISIAFSLTSQKIQVKIPINSFKFKSALMEEHFNENYLESEKYPNAVFDGVLFQPIDVKKDGDFPVIVKGKLNIHGIIEDREIVLNFQVKNGIISGKTIFKVKCVDHKIEIPNLVLNNIAESIEISASAIFEEVKK